MRASAWTTVLTYGPLGCCSSVCWPATSPGRRRCLLTPSTRSLSAGRGEERTQFHPNGGASPSRPCACSAGCSLWSRTAAALSKRCLGTSATLGCWMLRTTTMATVTQEVQVEERGLVGVVEEGEVREERWRALSLHLHLEKKTRSSWWREWSSRLYLLSPRCRLYLPCLQWRWRGGTVAGLKAGWWNQVAATISCPSPPTAPCHPPTVTIGCREKTVRRVAACWWLHP